METIKTVSTHDVVCFVLETHLWSGRIQLRAEDLKKFSSSAAPLPDSALASLGSVKICDPEVVRKFERLKREAQAVLETTGLNLFKARAVPMHRHAEVRAKLEDIKARFNDEARQLLLAYDQVIGAWRTKWLAENPGYGHLLDRIPKAETVFGRLSFEYHDYRVEPPMGSFEDEAGADFTTKLTGLRGELYAEAAREAVALLESIFDKAGSKRDYITPKTLGPFKRIADRFRDFQAIDPSAVSAAELIDATISQALASAQTDKNNRISDGPMMLVLSMANIFSNPATAARIAEKSRNEGVDATFEHLLEMDGHAANVAKPEGVVQATTTVNDAAHFESSLQVMKQSVSQADNQTVNELASLARRNQIEVIEIPEVTEVATAAPEQQPLAPSALEGIDQLFMF